MLDINIRVVTFAANHPACYISLRYFMEAWKINAGSYYSRTRFTIMLPDHPSEECLSICGELGVSFPVELIQVPAQVSVDYRCYWPMSFLDHEFSEDMLIYCPPHVLLSQDISALIERSHLEQLIMAPAFLQIDRPSENTRNALQKTTGAAVSGLMSMWITILPNSTRQHFTGNFSSTLARLGFSENDPPTYDDVMGLLACTFTCLLNEMHVAHEIIGPEYFYELCDESIRTTVIADFDKIFFYAVTEDANAEFTWGGIFHDADTVQSFLDNASLSNAWLYYQRNLRRVHASLNLTTFSRRNLFQAKRNPYYIFAPDYIQQSAGIRALHYLCHALNESGQEAYITCLTTSPNLRTPVLSAETMMQHRSTGRLPIMVYPEIVSGDPLAAGGIVVRWLLNQPGHIGGDISFPSDNLIFTYEQSYLPEGMQGEALHLPTSDLSIFNNDDNPYDNAREFVCFYAHKYLASGGQLSEHVKDAVSLCKDQKLTHPELAGILRRSKLLYVYESTALIAEALLCGCPVSIIETDYWRNNMANYTYAGDLGVVMDDSPASLVQARATVGKYRVIHEERVMREAWNQIDRFIELTQRAVRALSRSA